MSSVTVSWNVNDVGPVGAVKLGVAVSAAESVTLGPAVWDHA
jgi:hypothetical protein